MCSNGGRHSWPESPLKVLIKANQACPPKSSKQILWGEFVAVEIIIHSVSVGDSSFNGLNPGAFLNSRVWGAIQLSGGFGRLGTRTQECIVLAGFEYRYSATQTARLIPHSFVVNYSKTNFFSRYSGKKPAFASCSCPSKTSLTESNNGLDGRMWPIGRQDPRLQ